MYAIFHCPVASHVAFLALSLFPVPFVILYPPLHVVVANEWTAFVAFEYAIVALFTVGTSPHSGK